MKDKKLRESLKIRYHKKKKYGFLTIDQNNPLKELIEWIDDSLEKRNERIKMMYKKTIKNEKLLNLLLEHFNLESVVLIEQGKTTKVERKLRKIKKVENKNIN